MMIVGTIKQQIIAGRLEKKAHRSSDWSDSLSQKATAESVGPAGHFPRPRKDRLRLQKISNVVG